MSPARRACRRGNAPRCVSTVRRIGRRGSGNGDTSSRSARWRRGAPPTWSPRRAPRRPAAARARAGGPALFALLTDDFVGTVSTGMPHGVGGEHRGAVDMITGVWARIASVYDMHVDPLDYLHVDDDRVVVLGRYWGSARDGGSAVDA